MYEDIIDGLYGVEYKENVRLDGYTSFKVGGAADLMVFPDGVDSLKRVLDRLKGTEHVVIGNGTNILVSDKGYRGVVVCTKKMTGIKVVGNILVCECGVRLSAAVRTCVENSLSGLEFAVDIPGTVGGLVAMNGGCYNKSCEDVVCYVVAENGVYNRSDCEFSYRKSRFSGGECVYKAAFKLKTAEEDVIEYKLQRFKGARGKAQPKGNSCGSVFLNDGYFAGKIIDQAGLKGYRIGGAKVSDEHANFIICDGKSAQDVYDLIRYIKKKVFIDTGTELREEVKYIGEFDENRL